MEPVSLNQIETFLNHQPVILYGVSRNKNKMGNHILKELTAKGLKIFPMHNEMEKIENQKCYKNLSSLPEKVHTALICTQSDKTTEILDELKLSGVENIWIQQGAASKDVIEKAKDHFKNVVYGKCIMMFANQTGMHKFHSNILRLFGKYPK